MSKPVIYGMTAIPRGTERIKSRPETSCNRKMVRNMNGASNGNYRSNGFHRSNRRGGRGGNYNYQPYRYQQQNFPKLPDRAGDEMSQDTAEEPQEQPPTPTPYPQDEERVVSPAPAQNESQPSVGLVWQGVPPNYKMDPNQLFVLTGPFEDNGSASYEAHPVPKGATVFATPAITAPYWPSGNDIVINFQGNSPLTATNAPGFNPNAAPFYPQKKSEADIDDNKENESKEAQDDGESENSNEELAKRNPSMTVFNAMFPKGKAFPLRQPQPPVYFQTPIYPEMMNHGQSGDHAGTEENNNDQPSIPAKDEKSTTQMLSVEV